MAGIADIRFLTRPVRGYAGGDLVINPPTAAEKLGISDVKTPFMEEYAKNLEDASQFAVDHAVGELENQIAKELRSRYKVEFDWKGFKKGFKNFMMNKNPDGSSKLKEGKLPKDWVKQNRKQLGSLLNKLPSGPGGTLRRSAGKFLLTSALKIGKNIASPATQTIQDYLSRSEYVRGIAAKGKEIDEAIAQIDPDLIKNMTGKDLQIYLKDNFDLDVTNRTMYRKIQKRKIPVKSNIDWEIGSKVQEAFNEIGDKDYFETITKDELWAKPQIQKIAKEGFLTPETLSQLRNKLGYPIERDWVNYFDKFGVDHDAVIKYITENNPTTPQLIKKFPKLQQKDGPVQPYSIAQWRARNKLAYVIPKDHRSAAKIKRLEDLKLTRALHMPSSKDIENVSPVIKDAIQKELDRGQVESYHPAMVKHRGDVSGIGSDRITLQNYLTEGHKEAAYEIGTDLRNKLHVRFEEWIPTVTAKKNKLISQFKNNEIAKDDFLGSLEEINNDLNLAKADMEKLGLMSKLFNPRTRRKEYFGKPYNNTLDLIKDIRNEYNLFSKVGKEAGTLGGKEKTPGLKKEKYNEGGMDYLTRPL
jgi:soluble cytochrome b562